MANLDLELRGEGEERVGHSFFLLSSPAFFPSVMSSFFFTQSKGGRGFRGAWAPPLDLSLVDLLLKEFLFHGAGNKARFSFIILIFRFLSQLAISSPSSDF